MLAAVVATATVLAACSSSGSKDTGGGGASTSSGGSTSASSSSGIADAKAFVAKYSERPTKIPVTAPVGTTVPKGKTVYFISCGTPECGEESAIIKQGT